MILFVSIILINVAVLIYLLHLCNHSNLNFQRKSCGSPCEDVMHKSRQLKSLQHIQKEVLCIVICFSSKSGVR